MHILFLAAENGALEGGKVGGIGDVVGQLPPALADFGCTVTVVTPSHGFLHKGPEAKKLPPFQCRFRGFTHWADLYELPGKKTMPGVRHIVIDHPLLHAVDPFHGTPRIYVHDDPNRPFSSDASRFALFCAAASAAAGQGAFGIVDVAHLHDWHAGCAAILQRYSGSGTGLESVRTVFSIHNLGLQGIRPLRGSDSSLEAWFPGLSYDWLGVADPRWHDCVNLMAAGIRLADVVHTVSPSYSREILQPSDPPRFYGAEGLESVLQHAENTGRLVGILNGCQYLQDQKPPTTPFTDLVELCRTRVARWAAAYAHVPSVHFLAHSRLTGEVFSPNPPEVLLTCVGRVAEQKMLLMCSPGSDGRSPLDRILEDIGDRGKLMLLGTGDPVWEQKLLDIAARWDNFIFLNGYSDACAQALYASGDLFLMPSSYEPCGISQMLAMRAGQPCVVHAVGGLRDTVHDGIDGFSFSGATVAEQIDAFADAAIGALALRREKPERFMEIRRRASEARFSWADTAKRYVEELYEGDGA
ncbi:MAG: glycogen/starch synthase [Desulfobacterales bacterium]|nr:glycogen/starch synthase [Desulfobacterales bacterium]